MQDFAARLGRLGPVECFDYAYQVAGRRSPDRLPTLIATHRAAFERLEPRADQASVLIGKSMGGRIGCHLALELAKENTGKARPSALVCLGYPLIGQNGSVRDEVLFALATPVLFVQGTRDAMCPLDKLEAVRARMSARSELHVVEGGDHSLTLTKTALKARGQTQADLMDQIVEQIRLFVATNQPPLP